MSFMAYINNLNTHNGKVGKLGEDFAVEYLIDKGHEILERNYKNKFGEIDIISKTKTVKLGNKQVQEKIHIVEVKTSQSQFIKPEENMHAVKMRKVAKLGLIYARDRLFCIDFVGVTLNQDSSLKEIKYLENLELF